MIKPICKDIFFLGQKSEPATVADKQVGQDLLDTLQAHANECVGMAANMIGVKKNEWGPPEAPIEWPVRAKKRVDFGGRMCDNIHGYVMYR